MLIPLTRKTVESLIPAVATSDQYKHCWGKLQDLLKRLLISITALIVVLVVGAITRDNEASGFFRFIFGVATGFYWLWYPIYEASQRNRVYRSYKYGGLWQGGVLDVYVTEELLNTEETVNKRGELVVVENRERYLNLEVGDRSGFRTLVKAPLQREHQGILPGMPIQLVVLSKEKNLGRIAKITDAYLPNRELWVSAYPYLRRDTFIEVSRRIFAEMARSRQSGRTQGDRYGYMAANRRGYGDDRGYGDARDWQDNDDRDNSYRDNSYRDNSYRDNAYFDQDNGRDRSDPYGNSRDRNDPEYEDYQDGDRPYGSPRDGGQGRDQNRAFANDRDWDNQDPYGYDPEDSRDWPQQNHWDDDEPNPAEEISGNWFQNDRPNSNRPRQNTNSNLWGQDLPSPRPNRRNRWD